LGRIIKDRKRGEKMNSKIMLVSIAVLAVGLFAMPSTVSLISGQHQFISYDDDIQTLSCTNCHSDVTVTGVHGNGTTGGYNTSITRTWNVSRWLGTSYNDLATDKSASCRGCHVPGGVNTSLRIPQYTNGSYTTGVNLTNVTGVHIAVRAQCTICHDQAAYGFNSSSNPVEAHKPLNDSAAALTAGSSNLTYVGGNDRPCIVCHTWAGINNANFSALLAKGNFNTTVSRYANNGSWNVTYS
jgi:hypothetical protein